MPVPSSSSPSPIARPLAQTGDSGLRSPPQRDFVLLCSPNEIDLVKGECLPRLIRFYLEPGLNGVAALEAQGRLPLGHVIPAISRECGRYGRILIDPAQYKLELKAWGKPVEPGPSERNDPRLWYTSIYQGNKGLVHVTVWQQPKVLGTAVRWETDEEGLLDFRRQVAAKVLGGIDETVKAEVIAQVKAELRNLEDEARLRPRLAGNVEVLKASLNKPQPDKK